MTSSPTPASSSSTSAPSRPLQEEAEEEVVAPQSSPTTTSQIEIPTLALYSDWHFCSACGLPPVDVHANANTNGQCSSVDTTATSSSFSSSSTQKRTTWKKLSVCTRCKTVAYHNSECQRNHWKRGHKRDCKRISQAIQPLLEIVDGWNHTLVVLHKGSNNNHNTTSTASNGNSRPLPPSPSCWWDLEQLDPNGARLSHRLWESNERRWNTHGEYLEAMDGFQRAMEPVWKLWKARKQHQEQHQPSKTATTTNGNGNGEAPDETGSLLSLSNLSLHQNSNNDNNSNSSEEKKERPRLPSTKTIQFGLGLAQRLLFCAYCEADGNQISSCRIRLAQCISILLECAYCTATGSGGATTTTPAAACTTQSSGGGNTSQSENGSTSECAGSQGCGGGNRITAAISQLLKDAWMELMLSYEEESSVELRRISRHVVHLAIQTSCGNRLYRCDWKDPLQRPGYMAAPLTTPLTTPTQEQTLATTSTTTLARVATSAPPYIPPEEHPPWCKTLESHWKEIAQELSLLTKSRNTAMTASSSFSPTTPQWTAVGSGDRGSGGDDHRVVSAGGKWTEYVLFGTGACPTDADAPVTKQLLRRCVPDAVSLASAGAGEVIFSQLEPRTRIAAHCGPTNFRWTAHLGLVIPQTQNAPNQPSCQIRVANQWHSWEVGKILLFDDSYEHEIRNETDQVRIVLLLRLWHPGLRLEQRSSHVHRALSQKEEAVAKRYRAPSV